MSTFSLPMSAYLLEQWTYLVCYLEDGRLELSNNRAERSIKPFVNTWPQYFLPHSRRKQKNIMRMS